MLVQVVSESLAPSSPLLSSLLLMDNDIATVAEGALDVVKDLKQLDLTGIHQNFTFQTLQRVHGKLNMERFHHIQKRSLLFL